MRPGGAYRPGACLAAVAFDGSATRPAPPLAAHILGRLHLPFPLSPSQGYDGHRLQLLSTVEDDVNHCQILFAELIYASVDKAPEGLKIATGRSVFKRRPRQHTDTSQVKAAIEAAVASQDLGKHDVGPSEAEVIAKVRAAKAAETAKTMPPPAAVAVLARKQARSTGPSQPSSPNPTPRAATSTAAPALWPAL